MDGWDGVDSLRVLVYGASGTGKTTFASTFPAPLLWLVCSGGNRPGELKSVDTPENRKRITPVVVRESSRLKRLVEDEAPKFATVVLDHASGLSDLVLKELLGLDELPAQKSWGMASQQTYGQLALQCKEYFRALLNLTSNVVILAQERTFGGREDGGDPDILRPTVGAALTPSLTGWLNPACDYVVQTFKRPKTREVRTQIPVGAGKSKEVVTHEKVKGVDYCLRTEPHEVFQTKFRIPKGRALPECVVDPDYEKVVALIRGE